MLDPSLSSENISGIVDFSMRMTWLTEQ